MPVPKSDFELLNKKYGGLVKTAALKISGDFANSVEDYEQEIWAHVLSEVPLYLKKLKLSSVEELIAKYDNYIKMWIWTRKNRLGLLNTKKSKKFSSNENETDFGFEEIEQSPNYCSNEDFYRLQKKSFPPNYQLVIDTIVESSECFKSNGSLNVMEVSRITNIPVSKVKKIIKDLQNNYRFSIC